MPVIAQHKWKWCSVCQCLWYSASTGPNANGHCAGANGGPHVPGVSGDYALFAEPQPNVFHPTLMAQAAWRWCNKCSGLWHPASPGAAGNHCPGGGQHSSQGSGEYALLNDSSGTMG
jgi:hypothetical protein